MSSPRVTTVLLPPAKGRSIGGDSRRPTSRGMPREVGRRIKTGENSRPTNGENSTAAHNAKIEAWRNRRIESEHPYLYLDGIVSTASNEANLGRRGPNVSLLVASAISFWRRAIQLDRE